MENGDFPYRPVAVDGKHAPAKFLLGAGNAVPPPLTAARDGRP